MELARLLVDLEALAANYRRLAIAAGRAAAVAGVVKADGYGLGAAAVARTLRREGCGDFFVATVAEGIALRATQADARIHIFSGPLCADDAGAMAAHALTPVLNDARQAHLWRPHREHPAAVHVDTGMNRLGFAPAALRPELFDGLRVQLLLTHLACADEPDNPMNARQSALFERAKAAFPGARSSLGNSAGLLGGAVSDLARPGIALYGGNPFCAAPNPMRAVATLQARVVALRDLAGGEPVGYGGAYTTCGRTRIAVLGIGYADGLPRLASNRGEAAFRGRRLPIVGRVSMDLLHIDATRAGDLRIGDWVELFGPTIGVDDVAAWADTIGYEILTGIGNRVRRRYSGAERGSAMGACARERSGSSESPAQRTLPAARG